ncbi:MULTISPECIES: methionyl-tRNA formyltransferase [unclassified Colwellia]|uniref:methionyl-tRNA formyltransferase n=1 Tax=unclassified Colwellia TaxID=196834 RepID=UPI0015F73862|nr:MULTISPECIES: methionyl-tRNA formyltransferase [unclassified Colwellia]MBA6357298.1 methionyl-tRNA formyltransferase [Colwellia sp. BRX8-3]MBA6361096.1 methionyl-tRNA formyltransferase [Colwellia sp. BRX8-6]MBA6368542.1 methionyl-tRNA formyltransferase [Colwellia sp. BRX8-5]MBA6375160.1 methionyl-tRNA formyltransferase [Colwellia sp. BRX8-2]
MSKALKIIFAGTPDFAAQHLAALINSHHEVVAVYCPPDKRAGRGKKLTACATKELALSHGIVVEQPVNFKDAGDQEKLASYNADIMVVVAYGLLLPMVILEAPRLGCVNVHGSILPKWRGAAPIQRSLEAGDKETGVTIMQMDKGLDTGDMIAKATCEITQQDTSATLYEKLADIGPIALLSTLDLMAENKHSAEPQDNNLANYAAKLDKDEAELDWQLPAVELHRKVRAYMPWPVAQFTFTDEKNIEHRIRIWQASYTDEAHGCLPGTIISANKNGVTVATTSGSLCLESLQLPGKKPMPARDILNGKALWFAEKSHINNLTANNMSEQ